MKQSLCSFVLVLLMIATPGALAQELTDYHWTNLSGTWRGEGLLRASPDDPLEQGVCRFDVVAQSDQQMSITGRCASAAQTGQLSTELSRDSSGTITGTAHSPLLAEPAAMTGTQNGGSIALRSEGPVSVNGRPYAISSRINGWTNDDQFSLVQRLTAQGGAPAIVLQMQFSRSN